jgi:hypothetical protein
MTPVKALLTRLLELTKGTLENKSILDLKARQHRLRYVQEVFKILPENTKSINIMQLFDVIPVLGRLNGEGIG